MLRRKPSSMRHRCQIQGVPSTTHLANQSMPSDGPTLQHATPRWPMSDDLAAQANDPTAMRTDCPALDQCPLPQKHVRDHAALEAMLRARQPHMLPWWPVSVGHTRTHPYAGMESMQHNIHMLPKWTACSPRTHTCSHGGHDAACRSRTHPYAAMGGMPHTMKPAHAHNSSAAQESIQRRTVAAERRGRVNPHAAAGTL